MARSLSQDEEMLFDKCARAVNDLTTAYTRLLDKDPRGVFVQVQRAREHVLEIYEYYRNIKAAEGGSYRTQ
jgi:hypothetical protein